MLIGSKSNLARLMATENLYIEQKKVTTAYFDLKQRKLVVPVLDGNLSPELYDLLLGHEVGHALETPEQGWHHSIVDMKVVKSILNVCEDIRIEKKIKRKFPGIRSSFIKGYNELMEKDFFGVKNVDIKTLNFIDRLNLQSKCGFSLGIQFSEEEEQLAKEADSTETFEDAVNIAKKIQEYMKGQKSEKGDKISITDIHIMEGQDIDFPISEENGDSVEQEKVETKDSEADETSDDENDDDSEENSERVKGAGGDLENEFLESKTDKSFREKEKELHDMKSSEALVTYLPDSINKDHYIVNYNLLYEELKKHNIDNDLIYDMEGCIAEFNKFKNESNKVVSYLCKEFELKKNAQQMNRAKVSNTGELDMTKIHNYKFTDDIFKRVLNVPNGKSHGLVMFIDWSGSMYDEIDSTIKQLINLTLFCRKVNIPFEVYAFSSASNRELPLSMQSEIIGHVAKEDHLSIADFKLLNLISSKMNNREYTHACSVLLQYKNGITKYTEKKYYVPGWFGLGGTPLNDAILVSMEIIPHFKKINKLQIVNTVFLTDGESNALDGYYVSYRRHETNETYLRSSSISSYASKVFVDAVTKTQIKSNVSNYYYHRNMNDTISLLKMFKEKTQSNVVGFYICSSRDIREALTRHGCDPETFINNFRKNNSVAITNGAVYDELYFLNSGKLDIEDGEFETTKTTTRGLVSDFSKYTGNKILNRVILSRFIDMIA